MINILDKNGNNISIYNANIQVRETDGSINYYEKEDKITWIATISISGTVTLTNLARFSVSKSVAPSISSLIAEISACGTRNSLNTNQLRSLKNLLRKFNSKKMEWNPELKNINL